ncbi:MAG: PEP-CTERM sorting domain-containing protein [Candidatus Competibacteraceae bacterium]|nr:PEP-CTERM sorting domain-containing protein [Candidatus Competibacteraceae bacterium]
MFKQNLLSSAALATLVLAASVSSANALTFVANPGTTQDAISVSDFMTSGGNAPTMIGLSVTATFGASSETLTWGSEPSNCGSPTSAGVIGSDWSLCATGNTFAALWLFTGGATSITSLSFAGIPSNIAFDRTVPNPGTAGSAQGLDFRPDIDNDGFADNPDWTVTYSNAIGLNGASPLNDLYGSLSINFGANGYAGNFSFLQDTDSFVPSTSGGGGGTIPEPASLALFGIGLAGLGFMRRRRT